MMYNIIKSVLLELLKDAEENTAMLCGDTLAYMIGDQQMENTDYRWGDFFEQISKDDTFFTENDNMQLLIKLN